MHVDSAGAKYTSAQTTSEKGQRKVCPGESREGEKLEVAEKRTVSREREGKDNRNEE